MVLKRTITRNIQNHAEVVIDYPATGLVVFTGENSNGKSVIVKVTKALITGEFTKPRCRASLINRSASFGEAIWIRDDNMTLTLHLTREAATTYVSLKRAEEEPIVRYLSDKSHTQLIREFGWHYDSEHKITLNVAEADEALLFYKTPNKTNGAVIHTATTDALADAAVATLEETISSARKFRSDASMQIKTLESTLAELKIYDIEDLRAKAEKAQIYVNLLQTIYFPSIPEIKPVPKFTFISVHEPKLPKIRYPRVLSISCNLPDMLPLMQDINTLKNNKCPTCGRGWDCAC